MPMLVSAWALSGSRASAASNQPRAVSRLSFWNAAMPRLLSAVAAATAAGSERRAVPSEPCPSPRRNSRGPKIAASAISAARVAKPISLADIGAPGRPRWWGERVMPRRGVIAVPGRSTSSSSVRRSPGAPAPGAGRARAEGGSGSSARSSAAVSATPESEASSRARVAALGRCAGSLASARVTSASIAPVTSGRATPRRSGSEFAIE